MMTILQRLDAVRALMRENGIDAYLVVTDDFHASEYVGDYFKVRAFLSGFTGSAGTLVILPDSAALFTDGRYFLQAEEQLRGSGITLMKQQTPGVPTVPEYLAQCVPAGGTLGVDGRTLTCARFQRLADAIAEKQIGIRTDALFADAVWKGRPPRSASPVWMLDPAYAGCSAQEKLANIRAQMQKNGADCLLLTALDEIAWLLNLRGSDVACTPVFLSFLLLRQSDAELFINSGILNDDVRVYLSSLGVSVAAYDAAASALRNLPAQTKLMLDPETVSIRLRQSVPETVSVLEAENPVIRAKAVKNETELANLRAAHIKDGVALTKFIYWLKQNAGKDGVTELSAAAKLEAFRQEQAGYLGQSFEPIIACGAHGAVIHYAPTAQTDAPVPANGFCLADTGGQYLEGTTDVTRTVSLGALTDEERRLYTLALRGHLRLAAAVFAEGCCGENLDILARQPLWENGLDYRHGTGHGVGYLLSVHEGPQRIAWRIREHQKTVPLEEGMILSNEPGVYLDGKFGVRHENLVAVREKETTEYGCFFCFETLTLAPFDRRAIDAALLSDRELDWLNAYHRRVYDTLSPYLDAAERMWLENETQFMKK